MTQLRSTLVLLVALVLSVFFAIPAEDAPETAYDESESQPCESTPVVSPAVPEIVHEGPTARSHVSWLAFDGHRRLDMTPVDNGKGQASPMHDSLTILDHSLRC